MQIENPQFYVNQSLRSQRKLKRSGLIKVFEFQGLANVKSEESKLKISNTLTNIKPNNDDLSKSTTEHTSRRSLTSIVKINSLKFNSKAIAINKNKLKSLDTRRILSNSSKISKKVQMINKMKTISKPYFSYHSFMWRLRRQ
jgi:hypothetical protein